MTYFLPKEIEQPLYIDKRKWFFLSNFERNFLLLVAYSSDKGAYTSSADQIWVIIWKISGNGLLFNKRGDDKS